MNVDRRGLYSGRFRNGIVVVAGLVLVAMVFVIAKREEKDGSGSAASGISKRDAPGGGDSVEEHRQVVRRFGTGRALRAEAGEETSAVERLLEDDDLPADERVRQLQGMRGREFSGEEREAALAFLAGKDWPEGMSGSSAHWLADELLTALRLQEPPWEGLAAGLGEVAFQVETDPVVRDYIMQHLGHWWEQYGARQEIESALWRAVGTTDETTPGSALIALSRGYGRDGQEEKLRDVRKRAFELAKNPETELAVRVTALAIAGDGGGGEVKEFAESLVVDPRTSVMLRRVAEGVIDSGALRGR